MRAYTERQLSPSGTLRANDLNFELLEISRNVNGGVDSTQHPTANISQTKFAQRSPIVASYEGTVSSFGVSASYHHSVKWTTDALTPNGVLEPGSDVQAADWRALYALMTGEDVAGTVLQFVSREGMVSGSAMVDYERRSSYVRLTNGGVDTHAAIGESDWIRLGVFVGDVLVADTGKLYAGRRTIELPFCFPAASGYTRIEVRYMVGTKYRVPSGYVDGGTTYTYPVTDSLRYTPVNIYSCCLWAQNRYR